MNQRALGAGAGGVEAQRPVPIPREGAAPFWLGGASGELLIQQCEACGRLVHPPAVLCPHDHHSLVWTVVSGNGHVESWTESQYSWVPGIPAPYLIALVSLVEDLATRLLTNLVDAVVADVFIGMPVHVRFLKVGDDAERAFLPVFAPSHSSVEAPKS
jgi:uncharacterized OB-fold protein